MSALMLASVAGEQVPAVGRAGAAVALQVHLLLAGGGFGGVLGVEADGDDFEILAGIERDGFQAAGQAVQDLGAEHGAAVIDRRQDHGLAALEEGGERDVASGFVLEHEVERDLLVEASDRCRRPSGRREGRASDCCPAFWIAARGLGAGRAARRRRTASTQRRRERRESAESYAARSPSCARIGRLQPVPLRWTFDVHCLGTS